jgi:DNA-binding PadR family transcriptional regulator
MLGETVGDDDLLAAICVTGRESDLATIQARLRAWLGVEPDPGLLERQLEQLRRAGLVRRFHSAISDKPRFHLTEQGVRRLQDRENEGA